MLSADGLMPVADVGLNNSFVAERPIDHHRIVMPLESGVDAALDLLETDADDSSNSDAATAEDDLFSSSILLEPDAPAAPAELARIQLASAGPVVLNTLTWDGGGDGSSWHDPQNWDTDTVPGDGDGVIIPDLAGAATIVFSTGSVELNSLQLSEHLSVTGGELTLNDPEFSATVGADAAFSVSGTGVLNINYSVFGAKSVTVAGGTLNVSTNGFMNLSGGTLTVSSGTMNINGSGGVFVSSQFGGAEGNINVSGGLINVNGTGILGASEQTNISLTGGEIALEPDAGFQAFISDSSFNPLPMTLSGTTISGEGRVSVNELIHQSGVLAPGTDSAAGTLIVSGQYTAGAGAVIEISLFSTSSFDVIRFDQGGADIALAGTLELVAENSFAPAAGDTFLFLETLNIGSVTDGFTQVDTTGAGNISVDRLLADGEMTLRVPTQLTVTWVAAAGGDWSEPTNWSTGAIPVAGADVVIGDLAGDQTITVDVDTALLGSITSSELLALDGGNLQVSGTASVTDLTVAAGQTWTTLANAIWQVSGDLVVEATAVINQAATLTTGANFELRAGGSFSQLSGTSNFAAFSIIEGQLLIAGGALNVSNGVSIRSGGKVTLDGIAASAEGGVIAVQDGELLLLNNGSYSATDTALFIVDISADGTLAGDGTIGGSVLSFGQIAPGGELATGTITIAGSLGGNMVVVLEFAADNDADKLMILGDAGTSGFDLIELSTANLGAYVPAGGTFFEVLSFSGDQQGRVQLATANEADFALFLDLFPPGHITDSTVRLSAASSLAKTINIGLAELDSILPVLAGFFDTDTIDWAGQGRAPLDVFLLQEDFATGNESPLVDYILENFSIDPLGIGSNTNGILANIGSRDITVNAIEGGSSGLFNLPDTTGDVILDFSYSRDTNLFPDFSTNPMELENTFGSLIPDGLLHDLLPDLAEDLALNLSNVSWTGVKVVVEFDGVITASGELVIENLKLSYDIAVNAVELDGTATSFGQALAVDGDLTGSVKLQLLFSDANDSFRVSEAASLPGRLVAVADNRFNLSLNLVSDHLDMAVTSVMTQQSDTVAGTTASSYGLGSVTATQTIAGAPISYNGVRDVGAGHWDFASSTPGGLVNSTDLNAANDLTFNNIDLQLEISAATFSGSGTVDIVVDTVQKAASGDSVAFPLINVSFGSDGSIAGFSSGSLLTGESLQIMTGNSQVLYETAATTLNINPSYDASNDLLSGVLTLTGESGVYRPDTSLALPIEDGADADNFAVEASLNLATGVVSTNIDRLRVNDPGKLSGTLESVGFTHTILDGGNTQLAIINNPEFVFNPITSAGSAVTLSLDQAILTTDSVLLSGQDIALTNVSLLDAFSADQLSLDFSSNFQSSGFKNYTVSFDGGLATLFPTDSVQDVMIATVNADATPGSFSGSFEFNLTEVTLQYEDLQITAADGLFALRNDVRNPSGSVTFTAADIGTNRPLNTPMGSGNLVFDTLIWSGHRDIEGDALVLSARFFHVSFSHNGFALNDMAGDRKALVDSVLIDGSILLDDIDPARGVLVTFDALGYTFGAGTTQTVAGITFESQHAAFSNLENLPDGSLYLSTPAGPGVGADPVTISFDLATGVYTGEAEHFYLDLGPLGELGESNLTFGSAGSGGAVFTYTPANGPTPADLALTFTSAGSLALTPNLVSAVTIEDGELSLSGLDLTAASLQFDNLTVGPFGFGAKTPASHPMTLNFGDDRFTGQLDWTGSTSLLSGVVGLSSVSASLDLDNDSLSMTANVTFNKGRVTGSLGTLPLTYDLTDNSSDQLIGSALQASVNWMVFNGTTVSTVAPDVELRLNGLSFGSSSTVGVATISIRTGGPDPQTAFELTQVDYSFPAMVINTEAISGVADIGVGALSVFPNAVVGDSDYLVTDGADLDSFVATGTFNFADDTLNVVADQVAINVDGALSATTADVPLANLSSAIPPSVSIFQFDGLTDVQILADVGLSTTPGTVTAVGLQLTAAGIAFNRSLNAVPGAGQSIGDVLTIGSVGVEIANFSADLDGGNLASDLASVALGAELLPGDNGLVEFTISDSDDPGASVIEVTELNGGDTLMVEIDVLTVDIADELTVVLQDVVFQIDNANTTPTLLAAGHTVDSLMIEALTDATGNPAALTNLAVQLFISETGVTLAGSADGDIRLFGGVGLGAGSTITFDQFNLDYTDAALATQGLDIAASRLELYADRNDFSAITEQVSAGTYDFGTEVFSFVVFGLQLTSVGVYTTNELSVNLTIDGDTYDDPALLATASILSADFDPVVPGDDPLTITIGEIELYADAPVITSIADLPGLGQLGTFLRFSGVFAQTGSGANIGFTLTGAELYPGAPLADRFIVADGSDADNFAVVASFDVATLTYTLTLDQVTYTADGGFEVTLNDLVLTYDLTDPDPAQALVSVSNAVFTLERFNDLNGNQTVSGDIGTIDFDLTGVRFSDLSATLPTPLTLSAEVVLDDVELTLDELSHRVDGGAQPLGTFDVTAKTVSLFAANPHMQATTTGVQGTDVLFRGELSLTDTVITGTLNETAFEFSDNTLTLTEPVIAANLDGSTAVIDFGRATGSQASLNVASPDAAGTDSGVSFLLDAFTLTTAAVEVPQQTVPGTVSVSYLDLVEITGTSIDIVLSANLATGAVTGQLGLTGGQADFYPNAPPGNGALTAALTTASVNLADGTHNFDFTNVQFRSDAIDFDLNDFSLQLDGSSVPSEWMRFTNVTATLKALDVYGDALAIEIPEVIVGAAGIDFTGTAIRGPPAATFNYYTMFGFATPDIDLTGMRFNAASGTVVGIIGFTATAQYLPEADAEGYEITMTHQPLDVSLNVASGVYSDLRFPELTFTGAVDGDVMIQVTAENLLLNLNEFLNNPLFFHSFSLNNASGTIVLPELSDASGSFTAATLFVNQGSLSIRDAPIVYGDPLAIDNFLLIDGAVVTTGPSSLQFSTFGVGRLPSLNTGDVLTGTSATYLPDFHDDVSVNAITDGDDADGFAVEASFNSILGQLAFVFDTLDFTVDGLLSSQVEGVEFTFDMANRLGSADLDTTVRLQIPGVAGENDVAGTLKLRATGFLFDTSERIALGASEDFGTLFTLTNPEVSVNDIGLFEGDADYRGLIEFFGDRVIHSLGGDQPGELQVSFTDPIDGNTGLFAEYNPADDEYIFILDNVELSLEENGQSLVIEAGRNVVVRGGDALNDAGLVLQTGTFVFYHYSHSELLDDFGELTGRVTNLEIGTDQINITGLLPSIRAPGAEELAATGIELINAQIALSDISASAANQYVIDQGVLTLTAMDARYLAGSGITDGFTNVVATMDLGANTLSVDIADSTTLSLSAGDDVTLELAPFSFSLDAASYDADAAFFSRNGDVLTLPALTIGVAADGTPITLSSVDVGLSGQAVTVDVASTTLNDVNLGTVLTADQLQLGATRLQVDQAGVATGNLRLTATTATLLPGADEQVLMSDGADADSDALTLVYPLASHGAAVSSYNVTLDGSTGVVNNLGVLTTPVLTFNFGSNTTNQAALVDLNGSQLRFGDSSVIVTLTDIELFSDRLELGAHEIDFNQTVTIGDDLIEIEPSQITLEASSAGAGYAGFSGTTLQFTADSAALVTDLIDSAAPLTTIIGSYASDGITPVFRGDGLDFTVGDLQVTASNVSFDVHDLLDGTSASIDIPSANLAGTISDLKLDQLGVSGISLVESLSHPMLLANLLPLAISQTTVRFAGDSNGNGQQDAGEVFSLNDFSVDVIATFDFNDFKRLPFTSEVLIGEGQNQQVFAPGNQPTLNLKLIEREGKWTVETLDTITLVFSEFDLNGVEVDGAVTLGSFDDGVFQADVSGSLNVPVIQGAPPEAVAITGEIDVSAGSLRIAAGFEFDGDYGDITLSETSAGFDVVLQGTPDGVVLSQSSRINAPVAGELAFSSPSLNFASPGDAFLINFSADSLVLSDDLTFAGDVDSGAIWGLTADGDLLALGGTGQLPIALPDNFEVGLPEWIGSTLDNARLVLTQGVGFQILVDVLMNSIAGADELVFGGKITDLRIDAAAVIAGDFAIIEFGASNITATGTLFKGHFDGALELKLVRIDAAGNRIADGDTTTEVAAGTLVGDFVGDYRFAGALADASVDRVMELRVGVTDAGPVLPSVEILEDLLIDPATGLVIEANQFTEVHRVTIGEGLPEITDAADLQAPGEIDDVTQTSAERDAALLALAVDLLINPADSGDFNQFEHSLLIEGSAWTDFSEKPGRSIVHFAADSDGRISFGYSSDGSLSIGELNFLRGVYQVDASNPADVVYLLNITERVFNRPVLTLNVIQGEFNLEFNERGTTILTGNGRYDFGGFRVPFANSNNTGVDNEAVLGGELVIRYYDTGSATGAVARMDVQFDGYIESEDISVPLNKSQVEATGSLRGFDSRSFSDNVFNTRNLVYSNLQVSMPVNEYQLLNGEMTFTGTATFQHTRPSTRIDASGLPLYALGELLTLTGTISQSVEGNELFEMTGTGAFYEGDLTFVGEGQVTKEDYEAFSFEGRLEASAGEIGSAGIVLVDNIEYSEDELLGGLVFTPYIDRAVIAWNTTGEDQQVRELNTTFDRESDLTSSIYFLTQAGLLGVASNTTFLSPQYEAAEPYLSQLHINRVIKASVDGISEAEPYAAIFLNNNVSVSGFVPIQARVTNEFTSAGHDVQLQGTLNIEDSFEFSVGGTLKVVEGTGATGPPTLEGILNTELIEPLVDEVREGLDIAGDFVIEVNTALDDTLNTLQQPFDFTGEGEINFLGLKAIGTYTFAVQDGVTVMALDASMTIRVDPRDENSATLLELDILGTVFIGEDGEAGYFETTVTSGDLSDFGIPNPSDLDPILQYNTFDRPFTIAEATATEPAIVLAAGPYARIAFNYSFPADALEGFPPIDGRFFFQVTDNALAFGVEEATSEVVVNGTTVFTLLMTGAIALVDVNGEKGFVGSLDAEILERSERGLGPPALPALGGFTIDSSSERSINVRINTTSEVFELEGVNLQPQEFSVFITGTAMIADVLEVDGTFHVVINENGGDISVVGAVDLLGLEIEVAGALGVYADASLAFAFQTEVDFPSIGVEGTLLIELNTGSMARSPGSAGLTIAPMTLKASLLNASLDFYGAQLSGSLILDFLSARVTVPESSPLSITIAGQQVFVSGYIDFDQADFLLSGTINLALGSAAVAQITGSAEIEIGQSNGQLEFGGELTGALTVAGYDVITVNGDVDIEISTDGSFSFSLQNVGFNLAGAVRLTASFSYAVGTTGNIDVSFTGTFSFFNIGSFSISGEFYTGNNEWSITGDASVDLGNSTFGAGVSVSIDLSPGNLVLTASATVRVFGSSFSVSATINGSTITVYVLGIEISIGPGGVAWASDISGATVFLDVNRNGIQDANEPFTITDDDGRYSFATDPVQAVGAANTSRLDQFDLNGDRFLDPAAGEGQLYMLGGTLLHDLDGVGSSGDSLTEVVAVGLSGFTGNVGVALATVFYDVDGDGLFGAGDIQATTDENGSFTFVDQILAFQAEQLGLLSPFDRNANGTLDADEGRFIVTGGTEIAGATVQREPGNRVLRGVTGLAGATVLFDANNNGVADAGEPSVETDAIGFYSFVKATSDLGRLADFDTNGNGVIDLEEGVLVTTGGIDKTTGLVNTQVLQSSAANYGNGLVSAISPLTNLQVALIDSGLSDDEASRLINVSLGLPENQPLALLTLSEAEQGGGSADPAFETRAAQINVLLQSSAALLADDTNISDAQAMDSVVASLAALLREGQATAGSQQTPSLLNDANLIDRVLSDAAADLGVDVDRSLRNSVSQVVAGVNSQIDIVGLSDGVDVTTVLAPYKSLSQTGLSDTIGQVKSGNLAAGQLVEQFTGESLAQAVNSVELTVPNVTPPPADIPLPEVSNVTDRVLLSGYLNSLLNDQGLDIEALIYGSEQDMADLLNADADAELLEQLLRMLQLETLVTQGVQTVSMAQSGLESAERPTAMRGLAPVDL